jgi:hypothetical protein
LAYPMVVGFCAAVQRRAFGPDGLVSGTL